MLLKIFPSKLAVFLSTLLARIRKKVFAFELAFDPQLKKNNNKNIINTTLNNQLSRIHYKLAYNELRRVSNWIQYSQPSI